jgi:hypothetical protein
MEDGGWRIEDGAFPLRSIFLALPGYGGVEPDTMLAVADAIFTARRGAGRLELGAKAISLLARCFNELYCKALNSRQALGLTHFVMLHGDIAPESGWLWKLLDEMDACGADILSAVSPIKDSQGDTSTAILNARTMDGHHRLSYADLEKLPPTFDASHFPGKRLLVNTGLMAIDFRKPWVEKVWFEIVDKIERLPDGGQPGGYRFEARTLPEDWGLSIKAAELGARVFATQKISLTHWGKQGWKFEGKQESDAAIESVSRSREPCPCGGPQ